jgi:hypothetical protein
LAEGVSVQDVVFDRIGKREARGDGESNELLKSDFDTKGTMLVIHTKTDSDLLTTLGFVEQRQLRTN